MLPCSGKGSICSSKTDLQGKHDHGRLFRFVYNQHRRQQFELALGDCACKQCSDSILITVNRLTLPDHAVSSSRSSIHTALHHLDLGPFLPRNIQHDEAHQPFACHCGRWFRVSCDMSRRAWAVIDMFDALDTAHMEITTLPHGVSS